MIEYLAPDEASYLRDLVDGSCDPDFFTDGDRRRLSAKLVRLEDWGIREDAARESLRGR